MALNTTPELGTVRTPVAGVDGIGGSIRMANERIVEEIDARLSRIEGQIRGVRNMNAEGRLCTDVVTQIAAVRAALKKVADMMVADHVRQWLEESSSRPSPRTVQDIEELLKVFNQYYR